MRVPQTPTGRAPEPAAAAYPLLVFTMLLWGGNVVASKWAAGEVSPQVLTCLRWAFACLALALPARAGLVAEWDRLRRHWRYVLLMGACGYTLYASLFYAAGLFTSGINIALFQGAIPVLVILINYVVHRVAVTGAQILGVAVTLAGAVVAATPRRLAGAGQLRLQPGRRADARRLPALCRLHRGALRAGPRSRA